jgi:intein-encoded DNA endonuclease-like protein
MRLIDKISPKKLRELYWQRKMSSPEIAKIYHTDPSYIRDLLRKYGVNTRTLSEARKLVFKIDIPKRELKRLYLGKKLSSFKIAKIYKCGSVTIRRRLREYGIKVRTLSEVKRINSKINISKKELKNLYVDRRMSSPEIAKIYHCSPVVIRYWLRKYGIKIRTKSEANRLLYNINIPKKDLKKLYLEKKMSSPEIARKFKYSPGLVRNRLREYKIPIRSLQEALLLSNTPKYPRHNFSGSLEEKAYLIGFRRGDLYVYRDSQRSVIVSMESSKVAQIKLFENLFSKYGHIWRSKPVWRKGKFNRKYRKISVQCYLNNTFEFLVEKKDLIEPWILKNKKYFAAFLAGYADAEGSFCIYNGCDGNFSIRSQDKNILHQIRTELIELGILCRPTQIARKKGTKDIEGTISNEDIWGLWIYRKNALLKLFDLINPYLKHADKRRRMEIVKNNILERNKKYDNRQDTFWYKLYFKEGVKV